jgi:hypothetical protein
VQTEYDIRCARPDETERILALVKLSLGEGAIPRSTAFWNWKHKQNPFGESPCLVADVHGEIVALRTFMRWRWRSNDDEIQSVRAVDTATHPNWRHKGIFAALTNRLVEKMCRDDVQFIFNTPNAKSRAGYMKLGWQNLGRPNIWVKPLRPFRLFRQKLTNAPLDGRVACPDTRRCAGNLLADATLDAHLTAIPARREITAPRTQPYLLWRYAAVPGFEYCATWQLSGADTAIVIHRTKARSRALEFRICEFIVGPTRTALRNGRRVLREALQASASDYATAMARLDSAEARVLAACGFLPVPHAGPVFTVRPLIAGAVAMPDPTRRSSWRLSLGALELF